MGHDSTVDGPDEPHTDRATALRTDGGSEAEQESSDAPSTEEAAETDEAEESQEQQETAEESQEQAVEAQTEKEEAEEEAPAEEPATIEADDEAVAEQTGDVGVEPEAEEPTTETAHAEAEPSRDGEGDTAGILEIRNQVRELSTDVIGRSLDGIIEISRSDGLWRAVVEVIERRSVPDTQDILGQYEIELDENGEVIGYRRLEKYRRSDTGPTQH